MNTPWQRPLATPVTLDSCDREPIHIPGAIQPHGVLVAFDAEHRLRYRSANASAVIGDLPGFGERLGPRDFNRSPEIHAAFAKAFHPDAREQVLPFVTEVTLGVRTFDLILHQAGELVVAEFESRAVLSDDLTSFALKAHRAMARLKRQRSLEALLAMAVEDIRLLTGFDRVMAYRFRQDDSGDIVAEARDERLDAYLGRRYPASDIPAQARLLYIENTLRLISDVAADAVPVEAASGTGPLDMSHAVLRAVSPVHIEYLTNMGVGASMSVSIVVQGRLWGLVACHHMAACQVPYSVRMACDVIAQILAANVQTVISRDQSERLAAAATLRARLVEDMLHTDDTVGTLARHAGSLMKTFEAHALVIAEGSKLTVEGGLPLEAGRALVRWLSRRGQEVPDPVVHLNALAQFPSYLHPVLEHWCGMLALRTDNTADTWLILMRKEQVETIAWGGKPEKHYVHGPLGPRLTPRGSFDLWRETVRGTSVAWSESDLTIGRQLVDEMVRTMSARVGELNRARNQLLAILGHDLRDPLHSISMAARVLEKGQDTAGGRLGQRIQSSSTRMQRLVSQVLDMSRLQGGLGLGLHFERTELAPLVRDLVEEASMADPGTTFEKRLDDGVRADIDADRMAQVVVNLVSNARHHGSAGEPVVVSLASDGDWVDLQVRNWGEPIPEELAGSLFNPFKRQSMGNERNRSGLGLGLYIAHEIVTAHGGSIRYSFEHPHVVFSVRFPSTQQKTAPAGLLDSPGS
ncbi:MAG: ATP-binding protein [Pseudomonadota bacterium]